MKIRVFITLVIITICLLFPSLAGQKSLLNLTKPPEIPDIIFSCYADNTCELTYNPDKYNEVEALDMMYRFIIIRVDDYNKKELMKRQLSLRKY